MKEEHLVKIKNPPESFLLEWDEDRKLSKKELRHEIKIASLKIFIMGLMITGMYWTTKYISEVFSF